MIDGSLINHQLINPINTSREHVQVTILVAFVRAATTFPKLPRTGGRGVISDRCFNWSKMAQWGN